MKYSLLILFFGVLFFASCGGSGKTPSSDSADGIRFSDFDKSMASLLKIEGEIVAGRVWTDANGENVLVLSQIKEESFSDEEGPSSETRLLAKHFVNNAGNYSLQWELNELESGCGFENRAAFSSSLLAVTDLDKNSLAEITVVYRLGCSSELSPDPLRLLLIENGKQHKISGTTIADFGEWKDGGKTFVDPSFEKLNEAQRSPCVYGKKRRQAMRVSSKEF